MYVYILSSIRFPDRVYVGLSLLPKERLEEHNSGLCTSTFKHRPWRIDVLIWFRDPERAALFESYLKSGSGRAFSKRHL